MSYYFIPWAKNRVSFLNALSFVWSTLKWNICQEDNKQQSKEIISFLLHYRKDVWTWHYSDRPKIVEFVKDELQKRSDHKSNHNELPANLRFTRCCQMNILHNVVKLIISIQPIMMPIQTERTNLGCFGAVNFMPDEDAKMCPWQQASQHIADRDVEGATGQQGVVQGRVVEESKDQPIFWENN